MIYFFFTKFLIQYYLVCSLMFSVWLAFKPNGEIEIGGEMLDYDSTKGNSHFFKSVEGFIESLPESTYQLSIMMRTPWKDISKHRLQSAP